MFVFKILPAQILENIYNNSTNLFDSCFEASEEYIYNFAKHLKYKMSFHRIVLNTECHKR